MAIGSGGDMITVGANTIGLGECLGRHGYENCLVSGSMGAKSHLQPRDSYKSQILMWIIAAACRIWG